MEKNQEEYESVVINSNILFSSLIKEEGFTRAIFLFLKGEKKIKFLIPSTVVKEFRLHIGEISRKSRLTINDVMNSFERLIDGAHQIDVTSIKEEATESMELVNDENDAPFVAVALKYKPSFILTYNKKDYKINKLRRLGILVISPKEALDLIGIERLEVNTKERRKKNIFSYLAKLKLLKK